MAAYTAFTLLTTSWRTRFRKQANAADNRAATVAVDSLINYEAVKVRHNSLLVVLGVLMTISISTTRNTKSGGMTKPCIRMNKLLSKWPPL